LSSESYEVIVLGAGAAGLMCAVEAAKRGRKTLLLDHSAKIGNKIRASGGGRCNFTNLDASPDNYVSQNPHFVKSALDRYTPNNFLDLIKKHRIQFHAKKPGQLFCDVSAQLVVEMWLKECEETGVALQEGVRVESVTGPGPFRLQTNLGEYTADKLVVATGGLSFPTMGASDFGYQVAKQFGHQIVEPRPALDGFVFGQAEKDLFAGFEGLAVDSEVTCGGVTFADPILFTHKGLSGPGALQASLYWEKGAEVTVNFAPTVEEGAFEYLLRTKARGSLQEPMTILSRLLPNRMAMRFAEGYLPHYKNLAQVKRSELEDLGLAISAYTFVPEGTVGYAKAEVTRGGVDTTELSSKTMESKKTPGLFFIGEVVDVTGQLGGYNFQWAWSSGWAAGQAV